MNQLAPCAACAMPVSPAAAACPACGHPTPQTMATKATGQKKRQLIIALAVIAIAAGLGYLGKLWIDGKADDSVREQKHNLSL